MTSLVHKYTYYPTTLLVSTKLLCRVLLPRYPATYTAKVAFTELSYITAMILECTQKLFGYISQVMIISDFHSMFSPYHLHDRKKGLSDPVAVIIMQNVDEGEFGRTGKIAT